MKLQLRIVSYLRARGHSQTHNRCRMGPKIRFLHLLTSVNMKAISISLLFSATVVCASATQWHNALDTPVAGPDTVPGYKVLPPPLRAKVFDKNGKLQDVTSNPAGVAVPKSLVPDQQIQTPKQFPDALRKARKFKSREE